MGPVCCWIDWVQRCKGRRFAFSPCEGQKKQGQKKQGQKKQGQKKQGQKKQGQKQQPPQPLTFL
jgi:hypothetical protein